MTAPQGAPAPSDVLQVYYPVSSCPCILPCFHTLAVYPLRYLHDGARLAPSALRGQPVPPLHPPRWSCCHPHPPQWTRIATSAARLRSQQNPESSDRSHHHSCSYTVLLYSCSRHPGTLDWTSLRKYRISRYRRNLQNRNSAAAGIAIRFGPNILLKCDRRKTGPKYPTTTLDFAYKSSFSLNHYVQSLRPAHSRTPY